MTAQRLLLIETDDLRVLRLVCRTCRATVGISLNETVRVPAACPACREDWQTTANGPIDDIVRGLKAIHRQNGQAPLIVQFEVADSR